MVVGSQEKKKSEPAENLDLEVKIKKQVSAMLHLRLAGIIEEFNESRKIDCLIQL